MNHIDRFNALVLVVGSGLLVRTFVRSLGKAPIGGRGLCWIVGLGLLASVQGCSGGSSGGGGVASTAPASSGTVNNVVALPGGISGHTATPARDGARTFVVVAGGSAEPKSATSNVPAACCP